VRCAADPTLDETETTGGGTRPLIRTAATSHAGALLGRRRTQERAPAHQVRNTRRPRSGRVRTVRRSASLRCQPVGYDEHAGAVPRLPLARRSHRGSGCGRSRSSLCGGIGVGRSRRRNHVVYAIEARLPPFVDGRDLVIIAFAASCERSARAHSSDSRASATASSIVSARPCSHASAKALSSSRARIAESVCSFILATQASLTPICSR
jgi:hypothetical protein